MTDSIHGSGSGTTHDMAASPTGTRPRVVLGVSGGIAAYKACELLRRFTASGHDVTVVPPAAAPAFVGAPHRAALSRKPVHSPGGAGVPPGPARTVEREAVYEGQDGVVRV